MGRRHPAALGIEDEPGEQRRCVSIGAAFAIRTIGDQDALDLVEQRLIDDRIMLPGMRDTLVHNLAAIEPVRQHGIERTTTKRLAAIGGAVVALPALADDARTIQFLLQQADRLQRCVSLEDQLDGLRLGRVHDQLAILDIVAERWQAAHPHALLLRCRDLVADALAGHLSLELREGEQHVQRQSAHARCGVEGLGDRDERHRALIEDLDDLGEVGERSRETVDLVDDHHINLP